MKNVLITGASSGIGAEAARQLAAGGAQVILVARSADKLARVAESIGAAATIEVCDAASGEAVGALGARVLADHGTPDVVVHCAGAGQWKRIESTSPEEASAMIAAPYLAAFNVTQAFMQPMLDRRSGVLIHVNSPACFFPWPSSVGYAAARWALRGLHEALCQDLAGSGVHSCHAVFGQVDSPYFDHNLGTAERMPAIAKTLRTLSTEECGGAIARLAIRPRRQLVIPYLLRVYAWSHRLAPGLVSWLLRATAPKAASPGPADTP